MSTKYQKPEEVPTTEIVKRLHELSDAFPEKPKRDREFTMRIPAECDRDPDLVLYAAAQRLEQMQKALQSIEDDFPHPYGDYICDGFMQVTLREETINEIEQVLP